MKNLHRPLPWKAVLRAAETLMAAQGSTTTLEVKQRLRNDGYWALQADVSLIMAMLARERGWKVASTGRFRIYAPSPRATGVAETGWFQVYLN